MALTKASFSMISGAFYNVKDYGAAGDGSTDDATAIQAAITAANSAGGGTVYFPSGDYVTDSMITLYSDIELLGDMNAKLMPSDTVPLQAYYASSKSNIRITGLVFEGTGTAYTDGRQRLIQFDSCSEVQVHNCTFRKSRESGLIADNCDQGRMTECLFENNYFYGSEIRNGSVSWVISDCLFYSNGNTGIASSAYGRGLVLWEAVRINVTNCTFKDQTEYGLRFYSETGDSDIDQQIAVSNCTFENNGTTATGKIDFYLYNDIGTIKTFAISNCTFRTRSNNTSISVQGVGIAVSNCSFEAAASQTGSAFVLYKTESVSISNCVARDFATALSLSGTTGAIPNNVYVNNCQFIDCAQITGGIYGENTVYSNNYFKQSSAGQAASITGIAAQASSSTGTRLINNVFDNWYRGIQINIDSCDVEVSGNLFVNTSDTPIRCYGTDLSNLIFYSNTLDTDTNPSELGRFELRGGINAQAVGAHTTDPASATYTFAYRVGDRFYNTAPTAGTATDMGWVCTVAGTPGTWKGFGDVAS